MMQRITLTLLAAFVGVAGFVGVAQAGTAASYHGATVVLAPAGCKIEQNLGAIADDYISRCRKASVRGEFPRDYLDATLAQIKTDRTTKGRKAWKLLTDSRFAKP